MKVASLVAFLFSFSSSVAFSADYPSGPDSRLTPGVLCERADEIRYPEKIKYCRRAVKVDEKEAVVANYDETLGYHVDAIGRRNFKIDHYFPLCMGGSNSPENLWPQHLSISEITDPLENEVCNAMAAGKLKQADAIEMIKDGKANLSHVADIRAQIRAL